MNLFKRFKKESINTGKLASFGRNSLIQSTSPLYNSAFWSCIINLSRLYATLPWHVFTCNDGKNEVDRESVLAEVLRKPNPHMDSYTFRFVMGFNFELHGCAVAVVERSRNGLPIGLYPVSPSSMVGYFDETGALYYTLATTGTRYPEKDVLVIRNTPDGYTSVLSPIQYAENDLDLEEKCKQLQKEYYDGASVVGHLIKVPATFSKEQKDEVRTIFNSAKGYRNIVLDSRIEVAPIQVESGDISKLEEAEKWSASEVARRFNVPPFFIGDTTGTYNNAEQQGLQMVIYCLQPRAAAWENAMCNMLCSSKQYIKFSLDGLMRGDHAARASFYHNAIMDGWMSINEVRRLEELPDIGSDGDSHFFPMNYGSLPDIVAGKYANNGNVSSLWNDPKEALKGRKSRATQEKKLTKEERKRHDLAFLSEAQAPAKNKRAKLESLIRAQLKLSIDEIKRLQATGLPADQVVSEFKSWLSDKAAELQPQYKELYIDILYKMLPVVSKEVNSDNEVDDDSIDSFADSYSTSLVGRIGGKLAKAVPGIIGSEDPESEFESYESDVPVTESKEEINRSTNAFNVFFYGMLGLEYMHVVSQPDACSFCSSIDGKTVSVKGYVLTKGSNVDDGDGNSRHIDKNYRHPPFHGYCSCGVAPGLGN